jgi:hypothetical protein
MPFLHASYSGYFPFCIYEGDEDVGDGTAYPVDMSLKDAMKLYWKAKSFDISETWNTLAEKTTVIGNTNTILTPNGNLNKMSDLVCRPPIESSDSSGTFVLKREGEDPIQFQDSINLYLFQDRGVVFKNERYYPQISFLRTGGLNSYLEWSNIGSGSNYTAEIIIGNAEYPFKVYDNSGLPQTYNNTKTTIKIKSERESN